jgi:hypothetical protein
MTYHPSFEFDRTPLERKDPFEFWKRDDVPFFAAGACHILAYMFMQLHWGEKCQAIFIQPKNSDAGTHVYIVKGEWAFDANGWIKEAELREISNAAYKQRYPGWDYERLVIAENFWEMGEFEQWCNNNQHRPPAYFAYLPWERAYNFIKQHPHNPPD